MNQSNHTHFITDEDLAPEPLQSPPESTFHIYGSPSQVAELWGAMALAQLEFLPIDQLRDVEVQMKAGGKYSYAYAPLDVIIDATRPALNRQGIALIQPPHSNAEGEGWILRTILAHKGGARMECVAYLGSQDSIQDLGKNITYLRRYTYAGLVGAQAERDDDGNAQDGKTAKVGPDRPVNRSPRQVPPPVATAAASSAQPTAGAAPVTVPSSDRQPGNVNLDGALTVETQLAIGKALESLGIRDKGVRYRKLVNLCGAGTAAEMTESTGLQALSRLQSELQEASQSAQGA